MQTTSVLDLTIRKKVFCFHFKDFIKKLAVHIKICPKSVSQACLSMFRGHKSSAHFLSNPLHPHTLSPAVPSLLLHPYCSPLLSTSLYSQSAVGSIALYLMFTSPVTAYLHRFSLLSISLQLSGEEI